MFLFLCLFANSWAVVFLEEKLYFSAMSRLVKLIVSDHRPTTVTHLAELVAWPLAWFWLRPANSLPSIIRAQFKFGHEDGPGTVPNRQSMGPVLFGRGKR